MSYLDTLKKSPDLVSPGISACQGCGAELILRRVLQVAGPNSIFAIPPGCMAGAGVVGWNYANGQKTPVHITLLDNTAAFLSGLSRIYEKKGRPDVNLVALAGDGATADCGFQSLSAAAERGEKMLYLCYDNEGYMNTGYQRSSTTTRGSKTSTTPAGTVLQGKQQQQKYVPLIMAMHGIEYCATASPSHMKDFIEKVEKGLAASKKGFAYIHVFSLCPTGWSFSSSQSIEIARKAVQSNLFPLWEMSSGKLTLTANPKPLPIAEFVQGIGKFKGLSPQVLEEIQVMVQHRYAILQKLAD